MVDSWGIFIYCGKSYIYSNKSFIDVKIEPDSRQAMFLLCMSVSKVSLSSVKPPTSLLLIQYIGYINLSVVAQNLAIVWQPAILFAQLFLLAKFSLNTRFCRLGKNKDEQMLYPFAWDVHNFNFVLHCALFCASSLPSILKLSFRSPFLVIKYRSSNKLLVHLLLFFRDFSSISGETACE